MALDKVDIDEVTDEVAQCIIDGKDSDECLDEVIKKYEPEGLDEDDRDWIKQLTLDKNK